MDLTLPRFLLAPSFLARLSLPRWLRPGALTRPDSDRDSDAAETAAPAPAGLHGDLGLPPSEDVPPDAQSLRHAVTMRIG